MEMNIGPQIGINDVCLSTFSHHDTTNCESKEDCNVNENEIRIPINVGISMIGGVIIIDLHQRL